MVPQEFMKVNIKQHKQLKLLLFFSICARLNSFNLMTLVKVLKIKLGQQLVANVTALLCLTFRFDTFMIQVFSAKSRKSKLVLDRQRNSPLEKRKVKFL